MCTVMFIPTATKLTLVSCRDEDPSRPSAAMPATFVENNIKLLYPKDGAAGGTWIGVNEYGHIIVLLNGAFEKHVKERAYRKSRGLLVKEMLATTEPVMFWQHLNLVGIEPFSLVVWENDSLNELVWDGHHKHHFTHDSSQPHIWSSATLYDEVAKDQRRKWFQEGISQQLLTDTLQIHSFLQAQHDPKIGFVMNRHSKMATLSISIIEQEKEGSIYNYLDLTNARSAVQSLSTSIQIKT